VPKRHRRWRESENLRNFERFARKKQNASVAKHHRRKRIGVLPAVLLRKTTGSRPVIRAKRKKKPLPRLGWRAAGLVHFKPQAA
jgi:hypothetical protein